MGSTFTSLHYHIVFATKHRAPWINAKWRLRFHEYLGGTVKGLHGIPQGIGGIEDHVHLLIGLNASRCLSDFMREFKKSTSAWVRQEIGLRKFAWQEGYGAFTVSCTAREQVKQYIANQQEHHRTRSYTEEFAWLLKRAGLECDPK